MFPRILTSQILADFDSPDLVFLLGTRQTGKTTLAHLLAKNSSYSKDETWYFDFEDLQYRLLFNAANIVSLKHILRMEEIDFNCRGLIILDEIQLLDDPSNLLKLLHDQFPALKIIAIGSSSLQIKTKFSDSLAEHKRVYLVEPLNFDEFLLFRGEDHLHNLRQMFREGISNEALIPLLASGHDHFLGLLEEYLIYGGYPEVVLIPNKQEKLIKLDSIVNAYIKKDLQEVAKIKNLLAYNNLLKYLAINAGTEINLSSACETIGFSSLTLSKYLNLLKETFIVAELPPFFTNRNKEISKNRKIYFKDTGINNLLLQDFNSLAVRQDAGVLYKTYVFNSLNWNQDITGSLYFYRAKSKNEIDFILVKDANYHLIEVKSGKDQDIPRAMIEFDKKYAKQLAIISKRVINQSVYLQKENVEFLPAYLL